MRLSISRNKMTSPIGECAICGYVGPPHANDSTCPKCGGAWKYIEAHGAGNANVGISEIRAKSLKDENVRVAISRARINDNVHDTTIQRTVDGEAADLQLKFRIGKDGTVDYLHIHCQKDYQSSPWGKANGLPIDRSYEISNDDGSHIIRCKTCGIRWGSTGRMTEKSPPNEW